MASLLEVDGLYAGYGATEVIHDLSLRIEEGTITTLLGANGAGKTTTLRALCKMIRTRGSIRFAGEAIDQLATEDIVRRGVAHVPDGRGTFGSLTTEENLRLGGYTRRDRRAAAADQEILAQMVVMAPACASGPISSCTKAGGSRGSVGGARSRSRR